MLNVYDFYDHPNDLPKYKELNDSLTLLTSAWKWHADNRTKRILEPILHIILKHPIDSVMYAKRVLGGRWSEAEPNIMIYPKPAYKYVTEVLAKDPEWTRQPGHENGRWPDAEPYIIKDFDVAVDYASEVIGGRWPALESIIVQDTGHAFNYLRYVLRDDYDWYRKSGGRWIELEPYIMKEPTGACMYAIEVIKGRWPEAEPYIKQDPSEWKDYCRRFQVPKSER